MWHFGDWQRSWAPISQFAHSHSHRSWGRLGSGFLSAFVIVIRRLVLIYKLFKQSRRENSANDIPDPYTSTNASLGSYSTMYPATALAATVNGEARYICPGPLRPGKLRFWALITT